MSIAYNDTTNKDLKGANNPNWKGGKSRCLDCNKELAQRYSHRNTTRCKKCWYSFMRGVNHPRWSNKNIFSSEKDRYLPKCANCSSVTADNHSVLCLKCCKGMYRPNWKGGISTLQSLIRGLPENRQWIKQVMFRDNFTCQECGLKKLLQVHHIKRFSLVIEENSIKTLEDAKKCEELWDTDNGLTLCIACHKLTETYGNKKQI